MAQRTLADDMTPKQQARLETLFREELLATPSPDEMGPQRVIENEDVVREMIRLALDGLTEPYFLLIGPEVEVAVDYSQALGLKNDVEGGRPPCNGQITHRVQLFKQSYHCPSHQVLIRVLRKEGLELADAWDLRAFIQTNPKIDREPWGTWVHAEGTQIVAKDGQRVKTASAQFDHLMQKWEFKFSLVIHGYSLTRRIEAE